LKESKSYISCANGELKIGHEYSPLMWEGTLGCYRVSMMDTVSIPPQSELICEGRIRVAKDQQLPKDLYIAEASEKFSKSGKGFVARTVVNASDTVPIRMLNPSHETLNVYKDTVVGKISPIYGVIEANSIESENINRDLPDHLTKMYAEAMEGLTASQAQQIREFG